jgi:hypothetical protein
VHRLISQVRPVEKMLASKLYGNDASKTLKHHLFYRLAPDTRSSTPISPYTTGDRLTSILHPITLQEIGTEFGSLELRHIVAAFGRKMNILDGYVSCDEDRIYDLQAGHSTPISDHIYGQYTGPAVFCFSSPHGTLMINRSPTS